MAQNKKTPAAPIEQSDLFVCDVTNWPVKDDVASMEVPIFCLEKNGSTHIREYRRGSKVVRVIPSGEGAATVFDKDVLIYAVSQIIAGLNQGKPVSRTVEIDSTDFLLSTGRTNGGAQFERILGQLRRLRGTTIETNIATGGIVQTKGFSLIESYEILSEKSRTVKTKPDANGRTSTEELTRVLSFKLTLSEWLYNGLLGFEVLTLDRGYFKLKKSIERRLYEISRKHCGQQPMWKINLDLLIEKIGSSRGQERYKVRDELRKIIEADQMPEYRVALDRSQAIDDVVFYTRNVAELSKHLIERNLFKWFDQLERADNLSAWRTGKGVEDPQKAIV